MKPRSALLILGSVLILFVSSVGAQGARQLMHIVQPGETLFKIALRYGVELHDLASLNSISNAHIIHPWQELAIPDLSPPAASENSNADVQPAAASEIVHVVQRGEILGEIAKHYDVALQELKSFNDIYTHVIYPGQELAIPISSPAADETADSSNEVTIRITHVVQRGEVLGTIANRYGITVAELMSVNGIINPHRIDFGQELQIWAPASIVEALGGYRPATNAEPAGEERQRHIVRPGEYLSQIGYRLGISWIAIAALNGIVDANTVHPGMTLLIPNSSDLASYQTGRLNDQSHPGARVGAGRELVVTLGTQMAYAYEDGILKRRALVSTGLPATPTVQGDFTVKRKYRSTTMSGPDYHLENVEWVMYFYAGYGFHGTWWHNNFGQPMSHGCVNMTNADAKWFYDFADVGTPVHVRI